MGQISWPKVSMSSSFNACQAAEKNASKSVGSALCSSRRSLRPVYNTATQMNGKVQGLPTMVPIALAIMLPPKSQALPAAISICKPKNGVKDTATPQAMPMAMLSGVPGSFLILWSNLAKRLCQNRAEVIAINFNTPYRLRLSALAVFSSYWVERET